jgi:hypothetical protein
MKPTETRPRERVSFIGLMWAVSAVKLLIGVRGSARLPTRS